MEVFATIWKKENQININQDQTSGREHFKFLVLVHFWLRDTESETCKISLHTPYTVHVAGHRLDFFISELFALFSWGDNTAGFSALWPGPSSDHYKSLQAWTINEWTNLSGREHWIHMFHHSDVYHKHQPSTKVLTGLDDYILRETTIE